MSTTGKLKAQQLQEDLMRALNGETIDLPEGELPISFPHKYLVAEPEHGKRRVLWHQNEDVLEYVSDSAIDNCLIQATMKLPSAYEQYRITSSKVEGVKKYWMCGTKLFDHNQIKPVLQKSTPGYTFRRLDFDMSDSPTPLFDDFLSHVETNAEALLAYIGMLFDESAPRQYYLWLYGQGNDGKGTLARFLKRIFGQAYAACQEPDKTLSQDKFFTSRLMGKRLGVFSDVQKGKIVKDSLFLQLTGGDAVSIEYKGKDAITVDLNIFFMFLGNTLPEITGMRAQMRRAIICTLKERPASFVPQADYEDRLWEERAGILYKCWNAWQSMKNEHGRMIFNTEVSSDLAEDNETQWESFFNFNLEMDEKGKLLPYELADRFKQLRMTAWELREFKAWLWRSKSIKVFRGAGDEPRVYPGVKLKPFVPNRHLSVVGDDATHKF